MRPSFPLSRTSKISSKVTAFRYHVKFPRFQLIEVVEGGRGGSILPFFPMFLKVMNAMTVLLSNVVAKRPVVP